MEDLEQRKAALLQYQQQIISRLNQLEMEKMQLTQEAFKVQGQVELLDQLTKKEGGDVSKENIVKFAKPKEKPE